MKKITVPILFIIIFLFAASLQISTNYTNYWQTAAYTAPASYQVEKESQDIPLSFQSVIGNWNLKYSGNYGYQFNFYANYRALIILYLNNMSLVFKGVYTIEEKNKLKVNIYEMKQENRTNGINLNKGFVKAKSSYFLFGGYKTRKNSKETLFLRPMAIIIDGNNSEGYFEPTIKLMK